MSTQPFNSDGGFSTAGNIVGGNFYYANSSPITGTQGTTGAQGVDGTQGTTGAGTQGTTGAQGVDGTQGTTGAGTQGTTGAQGTSGSFAGNLTANLDGQGYSISNVSLISVVGNITSNNANVQYNFAAGGKISAQGNVDTGGNIAITSSAPGIGGFLSAVGDISTASNFVAGNNITASGSISVAGNITGGNIDLSYMGGAAKGNVTGGNVSMSGNITGGNIRTGGLISATGSITGGNVLANGSVSASGSITGANLLTGGSVSATSNVTAGNITTSGIITATGNIASAGNVLTQGFISSTGNIISGNIITGGQVSATGNVTAANLVASATVSTGGNIFAALNISAAGTVSGSNLNITGLISATGNTTAGNVLTAGQVSATGNVTTAGNFLGNLVGTTVSVTGNISAGNVIVNGQPTTYGYVNGAYLLAQNTTDQSVGLNGVVNFQTTNASNGSIITKTSDSQVTLAAGNTYKLEAIVRRLTSSSTWGAFRWYDVTNAAYVGIEGFSEVANSGGAIGSTNVATAYVTPSVNTTYELRQTTVNTISVSANYATIEITQVNPTIAVQATATGTINNQYASITNGTDISITTGVAKDVTFDTVTASSGIPYSTSTGVFTLTSGVTYRFTGELSFAGYTGYALYQLVDATTNTPVNNQTSANPSYNSGFAEANNNTYDAIYTPSTNQTVKFRVTGSSFTGTGVIRGGYYGRINVQQINNAFALNTLATMSLTGNITTSGNVSATGNVTGNYFIGNGSTLTSLTGANVTGTVPAANVTVNAVMSLVSNNQEYSPVLATNTAGNLPFKGSAGISWNPSTYALTAGRINLGSGIGGQGVTGTYAYGGNVSWAVQSQNGTGVNAQGQEIGRFGSEYTSGATTFWDSYVSYYQGSGANSGWLIMNAAGNAVANVTGQGIQVTGYTSATGNVTGGNVLTAGLISATGNITTSGNVSATGNITAANFFGNGGTLSNVATRFESSWTVPVGNSTQSFTVTASETYYMWVDCNIPNGILAWNATGTITNTNVPVVGVQYAWVYNGGGTPIDFTSIPNQFVGTANTILRSNVAPSSTTNRFDFGINNTSGGSVTVRYGWVAIS